MTFLGVEERCVSRPCRGWVGEADDRARRGGSPRRRPSARSCRPSRRHVDDDRARPPCRLPSRRSGRRGLRPGTAAVVITHVRRGTSAARASRWRASSSSEAPGRSRRSLAVTRGHEVAPKLSAPLWRRAHVVGGAPPREATGWDGLEPATPHPSPALGRGRCPEVMNIGKNLARCSAAPAER